MERREALRRTALLLGGVLSAPTIAGVLAGCDSRSADGKWRALTSDQGELVATIAEHIIPATDTPGARAVGVNRFVDGLLSDHYPAAERERFLAGLEGVNVRARRRHRKPFLALTRSQQEALLEEIDRAAYPARGAVAQQERQQQPVPRDPVVGPGSGANPVTRETPADAEVVSEAVEREMGSEWFWRRMKEVTLVGYYTSQVGANQELRVNPMGIWRGDIPYRPGDRAWA